MEALLEAGADVASVGEDPSHERRVSAGAISEAMLVYTFDPRGGIHQPDVAAGLLLAAGACAPPSTPPLLAPKLRWGVSCCLLLRCAAHL